MKSIKYLFYTLIAAAMFGCTEDATYEPGPVDNDPDCAALYFPEGQATYFSFDKENDALELELTIGRDGDSSAAASHLLTLFDGNLKTDTSIFSYDFIEFAAGQTETTITLTFPNAELGQSYSLVATFSDEDKTTYTSQGTHSFTVYIDYSWLPYESSNGETMGVWSDGLMGYLFGAYSATKEVEVLYTPAVEGLYRIVNLYTADFSCQIWACTEEEEYGYAIDPETQAIPIYTDIHAEDPNNVWIAWHDSGYFVGSSYGNFWYGSYVPENGFTSDAAVGYGTEVDGYISFPASATVIYLDIYDGMWLAGAEASLLLPGGTVPSDTEDDQDYVFPIEGTHTLSGYSYFDDTWYSETVTISCVVEATGTIAIDGLFADYATTSSTIYGTYDAETLTISIPDWQILGTWDATSYGYSKYDVYFANANDSSSIVFVSDGSSFVTSQWWGYYLYDTIADDYAGWWDVYTESNFDIALGEAGGATTPTFEAVDPSLPAGSYEVHGYSYFDSAWYSEDISISYVDGSTSEVVIYGLFYGYSAVPVYGTFDAEAQTITIPDWQNLGTFTFDGYGDYDVYFANAESEDPIIFTYDGSVFYTDQWWGYYIYGLNSWFDCYTESCVAGVSANGAPAAELPKLTKNIEQVGFNELSVAKSAEVASLDSAKAVKMPQATSIKKSALKINSTSSKKRVINPNAKAL